MSNILKKYENDRAKLESMFLKKQTPKKHASHSHVHKAHNTQHAFMYTKVYTCTHCGRKGHLAKFCFDKLHVLNFANNIKNVWVPYKTNPQGPKRKWVPKLPPCVFDVGEGSHMT